MFTYHVRDHCAKKLVNTHIIGERERSFGPLERVQEQGSFNECITRPIEAKKKKQLWPVKATMYTAIIIRREAGLVFGQKLSRKHWWSD